ncbi:2435_t:CDS:1 [Entrophospora sp. SA101]|nr:2435_t:CDS:1 [Entrophospora sp. SA101]
MSNQNRNIIIEDDASRTRVVAMAVREACEIAYLKKTQQDWEAACQAILENELLTRTEKSDSLEYDEIYQILTHPELNKGIPLSTTYKTYFWLCFLCGFCGGDAQRLKLVNVELAAINGLTITIPHEKNNAENFYNNVQINLQIAPKD